MPSLVQLISRRATSARIGGVPEHAPRLPESDVSFERSVAYAIFVLLRNRAFPQPAKDVAYISARLCRPGVCASSACGSLPTPGFEAHLVDKKFIGFAVTPRRDVCRFLHNVIRAPKLAGSQTGSLQRGGKVGLLYRTHPTIARASL